MAAAASSAEVASLAEMTRIEALAAEGGSVLEILNSGDAVPTIEQVNRTYILLTKMISPGLGGKFVVGRASNVASIVNRSFEQAIAGSCCTGRSARVDRAGPASGREAPGEAHDAGGAVQEHQPGPRLSGRV